MEIYTERTCSVWGLSSVWEHGPYIISHRDKQDTPSDQNSQGSSLTALMSPYGENNTFNATNSVLLLLKIMRKAKQSMLSSRTLEKGDSKINGR